MTSKQCIYTKLTRNEENSKRKIVMLKEGLNYEEVRFFLTNELGLSPIHGQSIPFVKTKERGFDRFFCMIRFPKDQYIVFKATALGKYIRYESISPKQQEYIQHKYFANYLMEELL